MLPLTGGVVWACPYVIRDSGFIVHEPKSFQVLVCVTGETPRLAEVAQRVDAAAQRELANANVRAQVVRVQRAPRVLPCHSDVTVSPEGAAKLLPEAWSDRHQAALGELARANHQAAPFPVHILAA